MVVEHDMSEEELLPEGPMCGRCYATGVELFPAPCAEKPEELLGEPLGMYHCPDCGAMLVAGMPHPELCALCRDAEASGLRHMKACIVMNSTLHKFGRWDPHFYMGKSKEAREAYERAKERLEKAGKAVANAAARIVEEDKRIAEMIKVGDVHPYEALPIVPSDKKEK